MSESSDLDINLKIAEIENWEWNGKAISSLGSILTLDLSDEFNPLTDNALCFELMVKHKIEVRFDRLHDTCGAGENIYAYDEVGAGFIIENQNINKAICLAIIEANK